MPNVPVDLSAPAALRESLGRLLDAAAGGRAGTTVEVKGPVAERANSRIFHARGGALPHPLAVKLCLRPHTLDPDPDTARRQYAALARLAEGMPGERFRAVRPYHLWEDLGVYAAEWVPGRSMTERLFRPLCPPALALELVRRAAGWLRCFHAAGLEAPGALEVADKVAELPILARAGSGLSAAFPEALGLLRATATRAARPSLPRSWIHGDFKTDNLLVCGEAVVGMDIQLSHVNVALHDVASFLNHLDLGLRQPQTWRPATFRGTLEAAFLRDYFGAPLGPGVRAALAWIRLYALLDVWLMVEQSPAPGLRKRVLRQLFRRSTGALIRELRAASR